MAIITNKLDNELAGVFAGVVGVAVFDSVRWFVENGGTFASYVVADDVMRRFYRLLDDVRRRVLESVSCPGSEEVLDSAVRMLIRRLLMNVRRNAIYMISDIMDIAADGITALVDNGNPLQIGDRKVKSKEIVRFMLRSVYIAQDPSMLKEEEKQLLQELPSALEERIVVRATNILNKVCNKLL